MDYKEVEKLISDKILSTPAEECKKDFHLLVMKLVKFVAENDPTILQKGLDDDVYVKKFFKLIASTAMDAMNPFKRAKMEKQFSEFMQIFPMIQKYSGGI